MVLDCFELVELLDGAEQEIYELVDMGAHNLNAPLLCFSNGILFEVPDENIQWMVFVLDLFFDQNGFLTEQDALLCLA